MIAKILLSSLFRKKTRAILLFFSIMVCSSLLFANEGFRKTCETMVYQADTRWSGNSDLYITPRQEVGAEEVAGGAVSQAERTAQGNEQMINLSKLVENVNLNMDVLEESTRRVEEIKQQGMLVLDNLIYQIRRTY